MISDCLSDAAHNIRNYRVALPECYLKITPELDALLEIMDHVREWLDQLNPRGRPLSPDFLELVATKLRLSRK